MTARDPVLLRVDGLWMIGVITTSEDLPPIQTTMLCVRRACLWTAIVTPAGPGDMLSSLPDPHWIDSTKIASSGYLDARLRILYDRHRAAQAGLSLPLC